MARAIQAGARFIRDEKGQDLLEYAMLASLIAIGAIVVVTTMGNTINTVFWQYIATNVAAAL